MRKIIFTVLLLVAVGILRIAAHCEIPCGIYDDPMRIKMLSEHILTIEKSITEIKAIEAADSKNYNQLIRWVTNKDTHATELQNIVSQYFMAQRIKPVEQGSPGYDKYIRELTLLHQLSVYAMKSKQSLDQANITKMRELLAAFRKSYLGEDEGAHTH